VDVKSRKVSGLKTHDYHLILQKLLPFVVHRILPEAVVRCTMFKGAGGSRIGQA
jgi:hypothetical protein